MTYYWSQSTAAAMGDVAARWAKEPPAGREVVPATAFLDPDRLLSVLTRAMEHYGTRELRPTAPSGTSTTTPPCSTRFWAR